MADLTEKEKDAFFDACARGHLRVVRRALEKCPAIIDEANADGWTGLMLAVQWAQEETVALLLSKGADMNVRERNGLTAADQAERLHYESISAMFNAARHQQQEDAALAVREDSIQQFTRGLEAPLTLGKSLRLKK